MRFSDFQIPFVLLLLLTSAIPHMTGGAIGFGGRAHAEDAPISCPNNHRSGPYGAVVSVEIKGKVVGTGIAVGPLAIIAFLDDAVKRAAPGDIAVGWFQVESKKKPVSLRAYDTAFGMALLVPEVPMKSCAYIDESRKDEKTVLLGTYLRRGDKQTELGFLGMPAYAAPPSSKAEDEFTLDAKCKDGCVNRFVGSPVIGVQSSKVMGMVVRATTDGKLIAVRLSFIRARISLALAPPLPIEPAVTAPPASPEP